MTNSTLLNDSISTSVPPDSTVPDYWPDFGPLQYIEVIYLMIITVLGTFGNLIVIFSIALERRVHAHGNIFIINLAVADLIVSIVVVPTVIANVVKTENALDKVFCDAIGFIVTTTCTCSLCNLMFIALNRYWAVVKSNTYQRTFSAERVYYMVAFTWLWSILLVSPTLYGWGGLQFDAKMMVCSWDEKSSISYTWFIVAFAILVPLSVIIFSYFKLFSTVRGSGRWVRSLSVGSGVAQNNEQHRRSMRKERSLLRTLLTTVSLFVVCWIPFAGSVLINPGHTPAHAKKVFGWLALTNSCVNFIIYGAMNPVFRRGYRNLFLFVFRCKRIKRISSTAIHGSFSDSFKPSRRTNEKDSGNRGKRQSKSNSNKDNSRVDTITAVPLASQITQTTTLSSNSPLMVRATAARVNEPSPLARGEKKTTPSPSSPPHKKGIVESIRKASVLRRNRPRLASDIATSEEDRQWRAKRNSAMLLQIQMGDELDSDDEFLCKQEDRYTRRTFSDLTPSTGWKSAKEVTKDNETDNNTISKQKEKLKIDLEEIAKSSLRGNWLPEKAVYTSKCNTPDLSRSGSSAKVPAKAISEPTTNVKTVSGKVDENENDRELSPEDAALNELNLVIPALSPEASHPMVGSLASPGEQEKFFPESTNISGKTLISNLINQASEDER